VDQAELISAAQAGDRTAFDELVRQTYVDTYTLALRLCSDEEDARDVVQDAYLRAWRSIESFRGDAAFSTWMYRITANCAATFVTKRRRLRTEPLPSYLEPADLHPESQPEGMAESSADLDRVGQALAALAPKLRAVVVLKDVYGMPHEAIADELGISVSAAKVRLHRGRRRLRDALYEETRSSHAV
jgi:RNA polymerase sigma-70 factor (ECF subfamily)